jgi:hypothetical protein
MVKDSSPMSSSLPPAALAGKYLRAFAAATQRIGEFDGFHQTLRQLISEDGYLLGLAELPDSLHASTLDPDFENLDADETVIAVSSETEPLGYLRYRGRGDGRLFEAEDLHLMGAIASFVSALIGQAHLFRQKNESARILQYLINQLPLAVLCFGASGELIIENKQASRLLRGQSSDLLQDAIAESGLKESGEIRFHLEAAGQLLYAEGRQLVIEESLSVTAFVLYDLSSQRDELLLQLECSTYRALAQKSPVTLACFEDRSEPGRILTEINAALDSLSLAPECIAPLDAFSCACVISNQELRRVRYLFRAYFARHPLSTSVTGRLVEAYARSSDSLAQDMVAEAKEGQRLLSEALSPVLLVLDPYPAVQEALELIAGETHVFVAVHSVEQAKAHLLSGQYDGLFLDLDSCGESGLATLHAAASAAADFKFYYVSYKQASMVVADYGLDSDATVLQKPFDAVGLQQTLTLHFNSDAAI